MASPLAAIEIGTSEVRVVVAEPREDGSLMITGVGRTPSSGVRKGEIIDYEKARICLKNVLREAEENAQVDIRDALLVYSGGHIRQLVNRGSLTLMGDSPVISGEDCQRVMEHARAVNLPFDHEILHSICGKYFVGDQQGVINPDGMEGKRLSVDMLILYGASSRMRNLFRLAEDAAVDVTDAAFSGLCCGLGVLSPAQTEAGSILIDLGGGTTDYVVYCDQIVARAGSLAVGGDHVTNDLSLGLSLSTLQAERLKVKHAAAMIDLSARERRIPVQPEAGFRAQEVPSRDVNMIVNARMEETLEWVKQDIGEDILRQRFGAGLVLTGGGARMKRVADLASRIFQMPCHVGTPRNISGLALDGESPEFAAVVGMLVYGMRNQTSEAQSGFLGGLLKKVLGK